jgi:nitroimidazol reductase NimA-like FMN-containing flavoprotein (pyridoxamine 5'-phosphate oxidase superfamily)
MTLTPSQTFFEAFNHDRSEMIEVLEKGAIGHLGYTDHNEVYVLPITYAYDHGCVYSHSRAEDTLEIMRANPNVCFQVKDIDNITPWKSIVAWGDFEEITGEDAEEAKQLLLNKIAESVREAQEHDIPLDSHLPENFQAHLDHSTIYRIKISKLSGCAQPDPL